MRLTEFSFEPIYPADEDENRDMAEALAQGQELPPAALNLIRAASLTFSVRRQMDRIAKYLARGYEWA